MGRGKAGSRSWRAGAVPDEGTSLLPAFLQPWGSSRCPGGWGRVFGFHPACGLGVPVNFFTSVFFLCCKRGLEAGANHGLCGVRPSAMVRSGAALRWQDLLPERSPWGPCGFFCSSAFLASDCVTWEALSLCHLGDAGPSRAWLPPGIPPAVPARSSQRAPWAVAADSTGPGRGVWGAWKAACGGPWGRGWAEAGCAPALPGATCSSPAPRAGSGPGVQGRTCAHKRHARWPGLRFAGAVLGTRNDICASLRGYPPLWDLF